MVRVGVDIGGTNIAVGAVGEDLRLVSRLSVPTRPELGAEGVADAAALAVRRVCANLDECAGVGVGCPGTCDGQSGVVHNAHNLGWNSVPLAAMLSERLGLPVQIENDANCAALAEVKAGAAAGSSSALMITLGTGLGGGLIIGGEIYSGFHGLGGEFGHVCIDVSGAECTCGERGCWEAYASATALIEQGRAEAARCPESALCRCGELDGLKIFTAMHGGDAAACRVVKNYCRYVAIGLTGFVNALYPETVVIGGGLSAQGETLLAPVREYVYSHLFVKTSEYLPRLTAAALGSDAGIIGAALLTGG